MEGPGGVGSWGGVVVSEFSVACEGRGGKDGGGVQLPDSLNCQELSLDSITGCFCSSGMAVLASLPPTLKRPFSSTGSSLKMSLLFFTVTPAFSAGAP